MRFLLKILIKDDKSYEISFNVILNEIINDID